MGIPFPLAPPAGMRDLLPPEAAARAWLGSRLTDLFARWGYDLVTTPPFEHAQVIERGLETIDRRDLLRFVEPESGEVALLRPDITPQIARIAATRLASKPAPWRLCYAGSVIRQRQGRARRQRQIAQAGVEHIGASGARADAEVIALAAHALEEVGLREFRIELHFVGLARAVLAEVPEGAREQAAIALSQKDRAELARIVRGHRAAKALLGAIDLYGGPEVIARAARVFGARSKPALRELRAVLAQLGERGLTDRIALDLGEVRDASYYTGVSFTILARGPGEALGSGGRYDGLLERFGAPFPATGFGLDLSNVEWALAASGKPLEAPRPARFALAGPERERAAAALRRAGLCAAVCDASAIESLLDYARAWEYDAAVMCRRARTDVVRTADRAARTWDMTKPSELARWARRSEG